ncbi:hypothetical protein M7I_4905 [Glarea lozoyensis 74030]|uniref:Uncharacterized protein n=1 Tax=Glarea lozoyensis (strain ATCC 74030 / MF5533) TaxID=1104152 RepID=H0EQF7_GLAL7|nr:hypothetical protein M7I_4905 [Glarea lozoyensis 74030]
MSMLKFNASDLAAKWELIEKRFELILRPTKTQTIPTSQLATGVKSHNSQHIQRPISQS